MDEMQTSSKAVAAAGVSVVMKREYETDSGKFQVFKVGYIPGARGRDLPAAQNIYLRTGAWKEIGSPDQIRVTVTAEEA